LPNAKSNAGRPRGSPHYPCRIGRPAASSRRSFGHEAIRRSEPRIGNNLLRLLRFVNSCGASLQIVSSPCVAQAGVGGPSLGILAVLAAECPETRPTEIEATFNRAGALINAACQWAEERRSPSNDGTGKPYFNLNDRCTGFSDGTDNNVESSGLYMTKSSGSDASCGRDGSADRCGIDWGESLRWLMVGSAPRALIPTS
jgi:hypothetical protein